MATTVIVGQGRASADVIHIGSMRTRVHPDSDESLRWQCEFSGTFQVVDQFIANEESTTFHTNTTSKGVTGVDLVTGEVVHWAESGTALVSLSRQREVSAT
jgi:hypothetical protein